MRAYLCQALSFTLFAVCASAQTQVTLSTAVSPTSGQPGITSITLTGSNFPAGTIQPASVNVSLQPAASSATTTTPATTVTTVVGTTRRVAFIIPATITVSTPTSYMVSVSGATTTGTAFVSNKVPLTVNPGPAITSITPNSAQLGQTVTVTITASLTNFVQGATLATFGAGVSVAGGADGQPGIVTVTSPTTATVQVKPDTTAAPGPRVVTVQTGTQIATSSTGFTVTTPPPPTITSFTPASTSIGNLVTVAGSNFAPLAGTAAQVNMAKQGGGTISAPVGGISAASLTFTVPAGAATGPFSVLVNSGTATSATPLTVTPSTNFTLTAAPAVANLIRGQSITIAATLASSTGFNQLAALSVAGVPSGVSASFNPQSVTAGQTSILTLTAPATQPIALSNLTVTASATVQGFPVSQSANTQVSVQAPTTSFLGQTVVSNSQQTPLVGVTVSMLGRDGNGNTSGCSGSTVSDGAGNFALLNLSAMCVGPQLVGYNGSTVTSPAGTYAGVNIVYTLALGQVTASPVLVHLPRIDNVETFSVTQNSATNQSYSYTSIPGLSVTVYAGTTFTLQDGSQPNPFPLAAVQVPVDRLPDLKPNVPTMIRAFIVAFQPANATTNAPVAVYFPNTLNTAPGTDMVLMTLDPTYGQMVPYGTGAVSSDATEIVPDADPAHPGHLYGLIHFDWHGPMPQPPPQNNPAPPGSGGGSGGNPGGGSGAGNGNGGNNGGDDDGGGGNGDDSGGTGTGTGTGTGGGGCTCPPCSSELRPPELLDSPHPVLASLGTAASFGALQAASASPTTSATADATPYSDGDRAEAGDPVDMSSGIQTLTHRDLVMNGSRGSAVLIRNYRSMTTQVGPFGIGGNHNFNYGIDTAFPTLVASINLIMPDGNRFQFTHRLCPHIIVNGQQFPCPSGMTNLNIPALAGAVLTANADSSADLRWKNGTVYHFIPISFQAGGMLGSITDPNGNVTTIARDGSGNVLSITDPVGRTLTFAHDGSNRITSITDPLGRTVQYSYNAQGSLATFTNPLGGVTRFTYDANSNLLQLTDPRGIVQIQNTLDANGRVIQQVRPDGGTLTFGYTPLNSLAPVSPLSASQVTDSNGVQTSYRLNTDGYVTDVASTQGQTQHITLQAATNIREGAILASAATIYTYDPNANLLTSTDPTGLTTSFTYDPTFNKVTSISDPLGNVSRFTYDAKGNLLTVTDANSNTTSYQYDSTGLTTQATDALNQTTRYTHDGFGNLAIVTDPLGNTTSYVYDAISRLVTTIDSLGRRTSLTYDGLSHLLTRTDAKGGVTKFTYDPDGNLLTVTDANNNTTAFTYDVMNRLATRTNALAKTDTRTYDTNGNLIRFLDRRGIASTFIYDNMNRLVTESYPDATVTRTYDFYGRLNQVNDTASGTFLSSYDLAARLLSSTTPFGAVNYTYDGRGAMASRQVAGQQTLTYSYDLDGNLSGAALPQASATFSYNARNQLTNMGRLNGVSSTFTYDADARLLSLNHAKGSALIDAEGYAYDAAGNRNSHSTSIGQPLFTQPTVNQFNAANQLNLFGAIPDSYDANGNLLQESNTTAYTWDGRNRLKSIVTTAGQTTTLTYDYAGNLIQQADNGTSLNLIKSFVLDNLTNVAYEAASDGTSYSVLSGRSIDSHLAIIQSSGQVQYGLTDALNSTVAIVDQSGAVSSEISYDPYGQASGMGTYPFQFTGRPPVTPTLSYYRARYYKPLSARFISADPQGFGSGDTNLYRYARGSPAVYIDSSGKNAVVIIVGTVFAVTVAAIITYQYAQSLQNVTQATNAQYSALINEGPTMGDTSDLNVAQQQLAAASTIASAQYGNLVIDPSTEGSLGYIATQTPAIVNAPGPGCSTCPCH